MATRQGMGTDRPSVMPDLVLGLEPGGFVDGIVSHQIVQWHNMGSAVLPATTLEAMQQRMRRDGLFHAATWLLTLAGARLLAVRGLGFIALGWLLARRRDAAVSR